jgi:methionyl-tRNA formyltransferase
MNSSYAYFGTPRFAEIILEALIHGGMTPRVVITAPDAPKGRKLVMTPSPVRVLAQKHGIPVLTPKTLKDESFFTDLDTYHCELFVVAAYGKIIPERILTMPPRGAINVHPSLLPRFRGPSPIESAILSSDTHTGVSIMILDKEVDHGPILAMRERITEHWPPKAGILTEDLAHFGASLLIEVIPEYLNGLTAHEQDHRRATWTKKIEKSDGLLDWTDDAEVNFKKIRAYHEWPGAYFFMKHRDRILRIKVTDATYHHGVLSLTRVLPEGKHEMTYEEFVRGYGDPILDPTIRCAPPAQ